jgi:hypothetical protein
MVVLSWLTGRGDQLKNLQSVRQEQLEIPQTKTAIFAAIGRCCCSG